MPYYSDAERIARHYLKYGEYPDFPRQHKHWALQGVGENPKISIWQKYRSPIMWGMLAIALLGITIWRRKKGI